MNVLDENIPEEGRRALVRAKVRVHQIGHDTGAKGMTDENIIPFLLRLRRPTFFTGDSDFYRRDLRHERYCLVWLDIQPGEVAEHVRRFLRHQEFNTHAKRMGSVIAVAPSGVSAWRLHAEAVSQSAWPSKGRK